MTDATEMTETERLLAIVNLNTRDFFLHKADEYRARAGMTRSELAMAAIKKSWAGIFFRNVAKLDVAELKTMLIVDQYMKDNPVGE